MNNLASITLSTVAGLSSDVLVLIALFVFFFLFAIYFGKRKIESVIIAFYPASLLVLNFPYFGTFISNKVNPYQALLLKSLIFGIFFFAVFYLVQRVVSFSFPYSKTTRVIQASLLSLSALSLSLVFMKIVVPFSKFYEFSGSLKTFLGTKEVIFWLMAFPIVILFIVSRKD